MERKPIVQTLILNATDFTELVVDRAGDILLQCREPNMDIYIANNVTPGTDYFTMKGDSSLSMELSIAGSTGIFFKASGGTPTLEVMFSKQI